MSEINPNDWRKNLRANMVQPPDRGEQKDVKRIKVK